MVGTMDRHNGGRRSRRDILKTAGVLATSCGAAMLVRPARATPTSMQIAIRNVVGSAAVQQGKVMLDIPPLVENGSTVAVSVAVESPMTPTDYVKAIHVFTEKNPQPNVISIHLGPRAGRANVATRMRLVDTQKIVAIAELSNGSFWSDTADVIITLGACLEEVI
jgi:sulfur-oxidizing protein SoxY